MQSQDGQSGISKTPKKTVVKIGHTIVSAERSLGSILNFTPTSVNIYLCLKEFFSYVS